MIEKHVVKSINEEKTVANIVHMPVRVVKKIVHSSGLIR